MVKKLFLVLVVLIIILIPFVNAMFTTPDPQITNIYYPQDLNHYTFERNNPYTYTDPNGKEPIKSQIGTVDATVLAIQAIEAANPDANAHEILNIVADQYPNVVTNYIDSTPTKGEYGAVLHNSATLWEKIVYL